jgi:hypothetical protein
MHVSYSQVSEENPGLMIGNNVAGAFGSFENLLSP